MLWLLPASAAALCCAELPRPHAVCLCGSCGSMPWCPAELHAVHKRPGPTPQPSLHASHAAPSTDMCCLSDLQLQQHARELVGAHEGRDRSLVQIHRLEEAQALVAGHGNAAGLRLVRPSTSRIAVCRGCSELWQHRACLRGCPACIQWHVDLPCPARILIHASARQPPKNA